MTLRQLALFILLGGLAVGGLLVFAGGWSVDKPERAPKTQTTTTSDVEPALPSTQDRGVPVPGLPVTPSNAENVFLAAAPENLTWQDPDNPGFSVEIPFFIPWKLKAASVQPLATGDDGGPVGVRCADVVFLTYRPPESHVEAMALKRGEDDLVLHREFKADEARIFGRLAAKLQSGSDRRQVEVGRDSVLQLSKNLHIDDFAEGVEITGEEIRIHPKLGTAKGDGRFRVVHDAFVLTGEGIDLHRLDDERTRIEIHKDPFLELQDNTEDDEAPNSVVDFGTRDFRRAAARAEGRAIVRHFVHEGEERLRIEMSDHVHVTHEAGRSLETRRLVVVAVHREDPDAPTDARAGGWRLRQLIADGVYQLRHTEESKPGQADVVIITTDVLTHDVPDQGVPSTLLEGQTTVSFEGSVPLGGRSKTGGTVLASCDDRAWIGPIRGASGPQGVRSADLRRVLLSGNARVEHNGASESPERDILEGDEIELIFQVASSDDDAMALAPAREQITALEFTARRNVVISGTRMNGSTDLLVARDISGSNPHISAIGPGTKISFPNIGRNQRLLGANPDENKASGAGRTGDATNRSDKESWTVRRLDAEGDIDVVTSLGGPSVGMPTHLSGDALSYDDLSTLAELRGAPATVEADAINGEKQRFSAQSLSLERVRGRVRAQGGVHGELWTTVGDLDPKTVRNAFRAESPERAAELEVETEDRIDIEIVRKRDSGGFARDQEQWIRISGPLKAELRSDRMTIDRLRANSLSVALALVRPEDKPQDEPSMIARRTPSRRETAEPIAPVAPLPTTRLSKVTLEAGEIVADIIEGHARYVEASEGVTLASDMGRLVGDRIVLRGDRQTADVFGDENSRAEAWFYDEGALRNQVQSRQFTMTWTDEGASSLRAAGSPTDRVTATLYNKGEPNRRGKSAIERYQIAAGGPITILRDRVDATDVWVSRSTRKLDRPVWTEPARLYAPIVEVTGRNLLTAPAKEGKEAEGREVAEIVARGPETYFQYRGGPESIQIWGNKFLLNVDTNEAVLTGTPTENVKYQEGDRAHSEWTRATIDLDTGLPRLEGPNILLRTGRDPQQKADGPKAPSNDR